MLRIIRKSVASAVSNIDQPEHFLWEKWLKEIPNSNIELESLESSLLESNQAIEAFPNTLVYYYKYRIKDPELDIFGDDFSFPKQKIGPVFFGIKKGIVTRIDLDTNFLKSKFIKSDGTAGFIESVEVQFPIRAPKVIKAKLDLPEIFDRLATLRPKIYNIDILKSEEFIKAENKKIFKIDILQAEELKKSEHKKIFQVKFDQIKSKPKIFKTKSLTIEKLKVPVYSLKNIQMQKLKLSLSNHTDLMKSEILKLKFKIDFKKTDTLVDNKIAEELFKETSKKKISTNLNEDNELINSVLLPQIKIDTSVQANLSFTLFDYQKEAIDFLKENERALLSDSLGLGKTFEIIGALSELFENGKISSALIICPDEEIGDVNISENTGFSIGWEGHFKKWAPGIKLNVIKGSRKERELKWKTPALVYLTTFKKIFYDLNEGLIDKTKVKKLDCLIIDEVQKLYKIESNSRDLFNLVNPKYFWPVTSLDPDDIIEDLNSVTPDPIHISKSLRRTKKDVKKEIPNIIYQDYWVKLDEDQSIEYADILKAGQEQIYLLLENGNPFRFQANIFTILHKINQICNFAEKNSTSPKAELLLQHLETIAKNKEKVLIFSQYEKLGTKRLEKILSKTGIKYINAHSGMSTKETETTIERFKRDRHTTALLVGIKMSRMRVDLNNINYIINFDQWWNPVSLWQTEELLPEAKNGKQNNSLHVYNYWVQDTLDEKIKTLLNKKGFLNKNIFDTLTQESLSELISLEEWKEVLDIKTTGKNEVESEKPDIDLQSLSLLDLKRRAENLLIRLGYKDLTSKESEKQDEQLIYAKYFKGSKNINLTLTILKQDFVSNSKVEEIIKDAESKPNCGKIIIVTTGKFEDDKFQINKDFISLLDSISFLDLLRQFNLSK